MCRIITVKTAPINPNCHKPHPAAIPKAADTQIAAAEVKP